MTRNTHDLVNDHFGELDDAQIADGTPASGDVPVSNGDGTRTWSPQTGSTSSGAGGGGMGEDGQDGEPGPPGAAGTAGAPGTPGATGAQGPVGPPMWIEGEEGEEGQAGPPGGQGPAGNPGANGATGPAGAMGLWIGDDGEDGEPGPPGAAGAAGAGSTLSVPTVIAAGTSASGTGDVTPGLPTGHVLNDILVLYVQSGNQAPAAPGGYAQMGPVLGYGTAAAAGAMRLTKFWKRDGGSETDPTVVDTGDHTLAQIIAYRGCPTTGDPFLFIGARRKTVASVTGTGDRGATPIDNCLVCTDFVHNLDSASPVFSSPTNASLTSVAEQMDVATADGNGGGFGLVTGIKAVAGSFDATTVTETSTIDFSSTYIMLPAGITSRAGFIDRQVFLSSAGSVAVTDEWIPPSAGKHADLCGIAGGGSGSAGRNASVASGGGGGGGGMHRHESISLPALPTGAYPVVIGVGGPATSNADGAVGTDGGSSIVRRLTGTDYIFLRARSGSAATASATGSGGAGGAGGGQIVAPPAAAAQTNVYGSQRAPGGTGATTGAAGSNNGDDGGGGGGGGGTTQAGTTGGDGYRGAGGGGGGRSNTNFSTGGSGASGFPVTGGATVGANGADSGLQCIGGGGGASGNSATGPGGSGGWPGGGGGGGGSQSGAQRGGAGADGVVTITTFC